MPVVFLGVGAPLDLGLVQSLAHPGGNMTGVTFEAASETYAKRLQILTEIVPNLTRVAVLRTIGDANVAFALKSLEQAAPQLGVIVLRQKTRCLFLVNLLTQYGHLGSVLAIATIKY